MSMTEQLPAWFRKTPAGAAALENLAATEQAERRALGERLAKEERSLAAGIPALEKARAKAHARANEDATRLAASRQAAIEADHALHNHSNAHGSRISSLRADLKRTAPPQIAEMRERLDALAEAIRGRRYATTTAVTGYFPSGQPATAIVSSNCEAVKRRLVAIVNAQRQLSALAETFVEDVDAAVAQIVAGIPEGLNVETPEEPYKAGQPAAA